MLPTGAWSIFSKFIKVVYKEKTAQLANIDDSFTIRCDKKDY